MIRLSILYHGNVDILKEELARAKPSLDQKYEEVLGKDRLRRVSEVAGRTLGEYSFFDDIKRVNSKLRANFTEDTCNKFIMPTIAVGKDGQDNRDMPHTKKIRTAPAFYISEAGTQNSSYKNILHSYVHEWNHFIWYSLQKVPLYLALLMQKESVQKFQSSRDWVLKMEENAAKNSCNMPLREMTNNVFTNLYTRVLYEHYEKSNRLLDKLVLCAIGIEVKLEWRGKPRTYALERTPLGAINTPSGGDIYYGFSDKEVIDMTIRWEDTGALKLQTDDIRKFFEMLRETKVSRLSLKDMYTGKHIR